MQSIPAKAPLRSRATRSDWPIPAALLALTAIPIAAGMARLVSLSSGAASTPETARFVAAPLPVVLHILSVTLYCVLGAFQFAPGFRRRRPGWHRIAGRLLVVAGMVAGLSGLWMTQFYPLPPELQGTLLYGVRLVVGTAMVAALGLGLAAIRRREVARHRAWMVRGYALGQGAGTQVIVLLPWTLLLGAPTGLTRDLLMTAAWAINLAVAEWLIRRQSRRAAGGRAPVAE